MMRTNLITLASAVLIGAASHAISQNQFHAPSHDLQHRSSTEQWAQGPVFARALASAMNRMHADMIKNPPTDDPDRDFLIMMIPHHEGAAEMARLELVSGRDPLVRNLAEEIIASQQAEIAAMKARLAILEKGADPSPGNFPAISGTRGK